MALSSVTGLGEAVAQLGEVRNGAGAYRQRVAVCRDGCRIDGIGFVPTGSIALTAEVVIRGVRGVDPGRLADAQGWRADPEARLGTAPQGLRVAFDAATSLPPEAWVKPVSTPYPLPVAVAGGRISGVTSGLDAKPTLIKRASTLPGVPLLGRRAILVDLEYADRLTVDAGPGVKPQIWLNDAAPPDILERVRKQGLTVVADARAEQVRERLERQGPALALWFHVLAGGLAVLLGAGALVLAATVDRRRRLEDLSALRTQGLGAGPAGKATLGTYPALVAVAAVVGLLVGLAAWLLTGWALPLAGVYPPDLPLPRLPRTATLLGVGVLILLAHAAVAVATGRDLRRRVERLTQGVR